MSIKKTPEDNHDLPEGAQIKKARSFDNGCVIMIADKIEDILLCGARGCKFRDTDLCWKNKKKDKG